MNGTRSKSGTLRALPPEWPFDLLPSIRVASRRMRRKVVVLDDDPTGTQTVHDIPVVTCWDVATLQREFADDLPGFFVLTNSRSLTAEATRALHRELAANLRTAAAGQSFTLISRSDSTLRGHFPAETDALAEVLGAFDLTVIAPFFLAGGRLTLGNTHYVAEGDTLIPAAHTPFARDAVFGYRHSNLARWIEEKTAGAIRAHDVHGIPLDLLRHEGPDVIAQMLLTIPRGGICCVNAAAQCDMEVFVAAALELEEAGRTILYRSAASLVAARLGQTPAPLLTREELIGLRPPAAGGLILAGSYVPKTTEQLVRLRARHELVALELHVPTLLEAARRDSHLADLAERMNTALAAGHDTLVFTSRDLVARADAADNLAVGRAVSDGLIALARRLRTRPRFLIAKGGITSSDIATAGLRVRRAMIQGQILPGVPVWQLGAETRFPGLSYVVFPGNVGNADALADAVAKLSHSTVALR